MKYDVSISSPWITPGIPSFIIHQSCPGILLRLVSHPSIHLPYDVNTPSRHSGGASYKKKLNMRYSLD